MQLIRTVYRDETLRSDALAQMNTGLRIIYDSRYTIGLLLLLGYILFFSICSKTVFGADPDFPRWQVGNWWKFNIESLDEVNFVGTQTYTVVSDDVNVFQNGQDFIAAQG